MSSNEILIARLIPGKSCSTNLEIRKEALKVLSTTILQHVGLIFSSF